MPAWSETLPVWLDAIWKSLRRLDLLAAIDILLVALLIYELLFMFQRTRAAQLLRGIAIVLILLVVSRPFFPTFHWVIRTAMIPGVVAIVILFQPEIRRALERIGRFRAFARTSTPGVAHAVVEAVEHLSGDRMGSLIALERHTQLGEIAATGTILNAAVSVELLRSLFYPNSALHDGGAVIGNDQIVAAGCHFPVSTNPHLDRTLGMRHRAGIGLSEQSDAAVIIVSEETGNISLAISGILETRLKRAALLERILRHMGSERIRSQGGATP